MAAGPSSPTRDDIRRGFVRDLVAGHGWKARVTLFEWRGERYVLKDVSGMTKVARRTFGRPGLRREARIYRLLSGLAGVPRSLGMIDRDGLVLEFLDAPSLSRRTIPEPSGPFFDALERILDSLHERRIVHLDLRQKRNVLVRSDGMPAVVDFEAAQHCGRGPFGWLLFRVGRWIDWTSLVKYRHRYAEHTLDQTDRDQWRRYERWRKLWFLTPHRTRKTKPLTARSDRAEGERDHHPRGPGHPSSSGTPSVEGPGDGLRPEREVSGRPPTS